MNISSKLTGLALFAASSASAQNLLINSDFEAGIDSWITFNNVEVSQDIAFDGASSAKLYNPFCGGDWCGSVLEQSTSCVPGQGYDASIMTLVSSNDPFAAGSGNFLVLQVAFNDGAGNNLSVGESVQINIDSALDTWTELTVSATAPAEAATVKVVAVFVSPNGEAPNDLGAVFVDAASLEEGEATGPVCSLNWRTLASKKASIAGIHLAIHSRQAMYSVKAELVLPRLMANSTALRTTAASSKTSIRRPLVTPSLSVVTRILTAVIPSLEPPTVRSLNSTG